MGETHADMPTEVRDRISEIESEISDSVEFLRFGASSDAQYMQTHARIRGLAEERDQLEEMFG